MGENMGDGGMRDGMVEWWNNGMVE